MTQVNEAIEDFKKGINETETIKVLKELFDPRKISMITELESDEIRMITRILVIADKLNIDAYNLVAQKYMELLLSSKRKSRKELIEAVKPFVQEKEGIRRTARRLMYGRS